MAVPPRVAGRGGILDRALRRRAACGGLVAATFLLLGSGEFEPWSTDVERMALDQAVGDGSVAVLPTASASEGDEVFDRWGRMGLDHYAEAGVAAKLLAVKTREDAFREDVAVRAESASMIYFSGGKPSKLADVLRDSPLLAAIRRGMDRGAVYAGCSAGAMVASRERNAEGRGGTSWLVGLGLVPHVSFGVHWDRAARIPGVQWWLTSRLPDDTWFVGIDERTAILGDGRRWTVHGSRGVAVRHEGELTRVEAGGEFSTG
ncbi:MAG: Type 1 glutamine amidotransferase-like domain-containing protein [Actinomycetota bacterium]